MTPSELVDAVRRRWTSSGVAPRDGATDAELRAFERQYGVTLPRDFEAFLKQINGMPEEEFDAEYFRFWPISEVAPVTDVLPAASPIAHRDYFVIADFLLWSHGYGINLGDGPERGAVAILDGNAPEVIAVSFASFLDDYIHDRRTLFGARHKEPHRSGSDPSGTRAR